MLDLQTLNGVITVMTAIEKGLKQASALVVFPGSDVWSSLQSLSWFQAQANLSSVFIYQTDQHASLKQGDRLRRFCSKRWPTLRVVLPGEPGAPTATGLLERLRDWRRFRPDVTRWILDVTGASRAMLGAVRDLLASDGAVYEIIYRDVSSGWQMLRLSTSGHLEACSLLPSIPSNATDAIPVAELVECFAHDVGEVRLRDSRQPESLSPGDLSKLVESGAGCNWDWTRMYTTALTRPGRIEPFTFEDFVAAALMGMGVSNVRVNVKVFTTGPKPVETLLDIIVHYRGCLYLFDCRARDERRDPGPAVPLITLEGLWPVCVALRPNRWATDAERIFAAVSGCAHVFDADACRHLFSALGRLLGVNPPQALCDLERNALRFGANRLPVFTPATQAQRLGDAVRVDQQVFDFVKGGRVESSGDTLAWRAARVSTDLWFLDGHAVQGGVTQELQRRLMARFAEHRLAITVVFFELTANKKYWHALVRVSGDSAPFAKFLHAWRKMPLIV